MKLIKKIILSFLFILPFIFGAIGFLIEGENLLDAAYFSFALYVVNPLHEQSNVLIEIARWSAPAVVASGLIVFIRELSQKIKDFFICIKKDSFALYGDADEIITLKNNLKNAVIAKDNMIKDSDNHIIMFKNDINAFKFYEENKKSFSSKKIYIKTDNIEMFRNDSREFRILNISEMVARDYWLRYNLIHFFKNGQQELEIAIIGFNSFAGRILDYAILNNIYSLDQKITYHIWGDCEFYSGIHSDLNLMNDDRIVFHSDNWQTDINIISKADRIILPESFDVNLLIMLADRCSNSEIHCYNLSKDMLNALNRVKITSFGQNSEVLTKENIVMSDIYSFAKCLNLKYACLYGDVKESGSKDVMEEEWEKLDAFTKNSNICAANYHLIRHIIVKNISYSETELAEMEHIRWCRFHFLNHWNYGKTANGKKDSVNRIHPCLVPFNDLSDMDKQKDFEAIEVLREVIS